MTRRCSPLRVSPMYTMPHKVQVRHTPSWNRNWQLKLVQTVTVSLTWTAGGLRVLVGEWAGFALGLLAGPPVAGSPEKVNLAYTSRLVSPKFFSVSFESNNGRTTYFK